MSHKSFNLLALLIAASCVLSHRANGNDLLPDQVFVQAGAAQGSRTLTAGAAWSWDWRRRWAGGSLSGHWEASLGRWISHTDDGTESRAWVTQLGATPVLRWRTPGSPWYLDVGVGANFLLPIYRSSEKQFSTAFNFGSHVAVGLGGGEGSKHDLSLRVQHFSNAGLRRPNPGEDFLQLRYTRRL